MTKISVLTVTDREICFPQQVAALKGQSLKDFEWIIIDDSCEQRHERYTELAGDSFPLVHVPPSHVVPWFAPGAAMNDAFVLAKGELIYFMADYIVPTTGTLQRHWDIHVRYPKAMISGVNIEVGFPPEELGKDKVAKGNDYRMGLFRQGLFQSRDLEPNLREAFMDGCQNFWTGRNDSAPLEALLGCNGIDEQYDGMHGYHDDDIAHRLMTYGLRYLLDMESITLHFGHDKCRKQFLRSEQEQQVFKDKLIPQRVRDKIYWANPHRNLKQERACLNQQ